MNYLITGITGFAAPWLAKLLLSEGHNVYGLIRGSNGRQMDLLDVMSEKEISSVQWLYGDLSYNSLQSIFLIYRFDGVFHLAAQSHPSTSFDDTITTFDSNVMGSVNLIKCIEIWRPHCHFMFCSTSEVYGDACKSEGILKEDMKLSPVNPYGVSKAAVDLYVQERIRNGYLNGFITRAFSHTGPRRGFKFSISSDAYQLAKMVLGDKNRKLLVGNLHTKRVVMDVRDCVRAYYSLMKKKSQGIFNVCGDEVYHMGYFTDMLTCESGLSDVKKVVHPPYFRKIDIQIQIGDTTRLKQETGWEASIPIKNTIHDLFNYWLRKLKND